MVDGNRSLHTPLLIPASVLSDGREAVVTTLNVLDPCQPNVRPIIAVRAGSLPDATFGPPIDLLASNLSIAQADGEDVGSDLFFPPSRAAFDLRVIPPMDQPAACARLIEV